MAAVVQENVLDVFQDLEYQPGGIVSRVVLKQPVGSVTAFAFVAGQELSEHTCPFEALVYVVDGEGAITVGGAPHTLTAGQMIRLPGHVPHAVRADRPFKMLLTMLRSEVQR